MATKKAAAPAATTAVNARPKGGVNKGIALVILAALVPFSLPTVILVFFTMLPTLLAWFLERGPNKYAYLCVGGLNFAGVFPSLYSLWFGLHNIDEALRMVTDPMMLMTAFGCAGLGWSIYVLMPPLVSTYLVHFSNRRVTTLKAAQKKLIEDWGDEVTRRPVVGG